jgi:hypothetical protein
MTLVDNPQYECNDKSNRHTPSNLQGIQCPTATHIGDVGSEY